MRSIVENLLFDAEKDANDALLNCEGLFGDLMLGTLLSTVLLGKFNWFILDALLYLEASVGIIGVMLP